MSDVFIVPSNKTFPGFRISILMFILNRLNARFLVIRDKNFLVDKRYFFIRIIVFLR